MIDYAQARRTMVDSQLRTGAITDYRLLAAMGAVPRERFVPEARRALAYIDDVQPLEPGRDSRAMPAPAPFAQLVQLADLRPGDRVLDVGCTTGYTSAVLAALAAEVVAVEQVPALAQQARDNLAALGIDNVKVVESGLAEGAPSHGPYDVIVIEGGMPSVPEVLQRQLADGGRLVVALGSGAVTVAHRFVRSGDDVAARAEFDASMPPLAPAPAEQFVF